MISVPTLFLTSKIVLGNSHPRTHDKPRALYFGRGKIDRTHTIQWNRYREIRMRVVLSKKPIAIHGQSEKCTTDNPMKHKQLLHDGPTIFYSFILEVLRLVNRYYWMMYTRPRFSLHATRSTANIKQDSCCKLKFWNTCQGACATTVKWRMFEMWETWLGDPCRALLRNRLKNRQTRITEPKPVFWGIESFAREWDDYTNISPTLESCTIDFNRQLQL